MNSTRSWDLALLFLVTALVLVSLALLLAFNANPFVYLSHGTTRATIKGSVTLNGKPLPVARVCFVRNNGWRTVCDVVDGQCQASRVPVDEELKVIVETSYITRDIEELTNLIVFIRSQLQAPGATSHEKKERQEILEQTEARLKQLKSHIPIPRRYESEITTPHAFTAHKGSQELHLHLEGP